MGSLLWAQLAFDILGLPACSPIAFCHGAAHIGVHKKENLPDIMELVTALAKLQLSFTAAVTRAKAAAYTEELDVRLQAEAVTSDTDMAEACCIRLVHGEGGIGVPKALEEAILSRRLHQQGLAAVLAMLRKTAASLGLLKRSDW